MATNEARISALATWAICGLTGLAIALGSSARAQTGGDVTSPASQFTRFLCEINLQENGLYTSSYLTNAGLQAYAESNGIVSTFNSSKLCTGSGTNENIKIDCTERITGWKGGSVTLQNVACTIGGAACGIPGIKTATNNTLKISGTGEATLTCQYKGTP